MKLGDRTLGISPQIWAVLEVLSGGDYGFYGLDIEGTTDDKADTKAKNHDVYTYPFKLDYSKYSTQAGALYQCCDASGEFLKFVHQTDMGLTQRLGLHRFEFETKPSLGLCPKIYRDGLNEGGKQRAGWHCIVGAKHFLIDWTARQYVETAPFPLIIAKRGLHIRRNSGDFYTAIRLSHPGAIGLREDVTYKHQQGYVWHEDIGWQPRARGTAAGA